MSLNPFFISLACMHGAFYFHQVIKLGFRESIHARVWSSKVVPSASANFIEVSRTLNRATHQHLWWHGKLIMKKKKKRWDSSWNCVCTIFKTMKLDQTSIGGLAFHFASSIVQSHTSQLNDITYLWNSEIKLTHWIALSNFIHLN